MIENLINFGNKEGEGEKEGQEWHLGQERNRGQEKPDFVDTELERIPETE
jgi:hypothetical protein